jgi:hypothetical protein
MMKNLIDVDYLQKDKFDKTDLKSIVVRPIQADERETWDSLMSSHHYLGFRHLVGESIRYVALLNGEWVALLGWSSAAFKSRYRDEWIGWSEEQRWQRLKYITNNSRFLILPGVRIKNLASKILSCNVKRLSKDWQLSYGHPVVLAETFVDHNRFRGTCYKAAGWRAMGKTRGFGRNAGRYYAHGLSKTIFLYPLQKDANKLLSAPFLAPEIRGRGKALLDINTLRIDGQRGLLEHLTLLTDTRMRRGIRHKHIAALAVGICGWLSGAKNLLRIGEWAKGLTQDILRRFGCRLDESKRKYIPPSGATLRRIFQSVDSEELSRVLESWLLDQGLPLSKIHTLEKNHAHPLFLA